MPPTANIMSGKTSVCSSPWVDASRSASVPGSAAAWPANAVTPPSSRRSAKSSTLSRDSTSSSAPAGTARARRSRARPRPPRAASCWSPQDAEVAATRTVSTTGGQQADQREQGLDQVAARAAARTPRPARRAGRCRARSASGRSARTRCAGCRWSRRRDAHLLLPSAGAGVDRRGRVALADVAERVADRGVEHRQQRLRVEPERHDQHQERRQGGDLARPQVGDVAVCGRTGPVIVRWYISRM